MNTRRSPTLRFIASKSVFYTFSIKSKYIIFIALALEALPCNDVINSSMRHAAYITSDMLQEWSIISKLYVCIIYHVEKSRETKIQLALSAKRVDGGASDNTA